MKTVAAALMGIALVLGSASFGQAAVGHGGFTGHPGAGHFEGHHFEGHHFDGRHDFGHRFHGGVIIAAPFWPVYPYYDAPPAYADPAPAPTYWYYCPSYGAYYPNVQSCPEAWVPVPVQ